MSGVEVRGGERKTEISIHWFIFQMPSKARAVLFQVQERRTWAITHCLPKYTLTGSWKRKQSWDLNPCPLIWNEDRSTPRSVLSALPNTSSQPDFHSSTSKICFKGTVVRKSWKPKEWAPGFPSSSDGARCVMNGFISCVLQFFDSWALLILQRLSFRVRSFLGIAKDSHGHALLIS